VGVSGIVSNWQRNLAAASLFGNQSLIAVYFISLLVGSRPFPLGLGAASLAFAMLIGPLAFVAWGMLAALGISRLGRANSNAGSSTTRIAWGAIYAVMLILPAIYTPYLRLWLPTESLTLLFAAGCAVSVRTTWFEFQSERWMPRLLTGIGAMILGLAVGSARPPRDLPWWPELNPTTGYRNAAKDLAAWSNENNRPLAVMARAPLRYYLALESVPVHVLSGERLRADELPANAVLVIDHAVFDSPTFKRELDELKRNGANTIAAFAVHPDLITKLDDYPSAMLPESDEAYSVQVVDGFHLRVKDAGGRD
jgi:hypothetical protein